MDNTFIINPSADCIDIKDTLYEKISAAQAIANCLLINSCNENKLCDELHNNVLSGLASLLDDALALFKSLLNNFEGKGE